MRPLRVGGSVLLGAAAGVALGLVAAQRIPPTYRAAAEVEFVQAPGTLPLSDAARDARIDGFVEAARSLPVASAILASLPSLGRAKPTPRDTPQPAALALLERLRPERIGATTLVRLEAEAANPAGAAELASTAAAVLIDRSLADRIAAIATPDPALARDTAAARDRAEAADRTLADFRARLELVAAPGAGSLEGDVAAARAAASAARSDAAAAAARARAASSRIVVSGSSIGQNGTASLAALRTQRAETARRIAVLADRFTRDYPPLHAARAEQATLDRAIAQEFASLSGSARADAAAETARAASLGAGLSAAEQRRRRAIAAEADLARLQRDSDVARDAYRLLQQGLTQRAAERSLARPELRLAAPASPPLRPASPDRSLLMLFGGLGGGLVALIAALWSERRRLGALRFEI
ncbi:MAG: hypothetical protein ABIR77_06595 [Sphingomicrobium sp.]